ncbi:class I SAM-dependent methyltransferase [Infirmifilum lucidum]|uniref:Class I SAM-dependent methyltransferase n=1 Tax=Infirmifilum lucidum TaxID=2776706 RepID=A0A7L9FKG9_9CREN|nr:class I SAM-dependent methyltransferase [Infirmifilum lucidum]QOJ79434.1 class I SAM-dependent methyltransferase [Infirmifilum lucidum]
MSLIRESLFTLITKTLLRLYMTRGKSQIFEGLRVLVPPACFPPSGTVSTRLLAEVLRRQTIVGRAAEIGCGAGALTLFLARMGVYAVATDISLNCLKAARLNALANGLYGLVDFVNCDSGSCIREEAVDVCVTNPPFLRYGPGDPRDLAIAGGSGLEVLTKMVRDCYRATRRGRAVLYTMSDLASGRRPNPPGVVLARGRGLGDTVYVFSVTRGAYRSSLGERL